ncbi:MAG: hypothetical protein K6G22_03975 [Lachnospiraceae bacterium]|nr:hypothetical protein [Lachnospiraceae bacterium]
MATENGTIRECCILRPNKRGSRKREVLFYPDIDTWCEEYVAYKTGKKDINPYTDPDIAGNGFVYNQPFYELLTDFLNEQNKETEKDLLFEPPVPFSEKGSPYDRTILLSVKGMELHLGPDQFGFSAFGDDLRNPYYSYVCRHQDPETAFRYTAECLYDTRRAGGCFFWPKVQYRRNLSCMYNNLRGIGSYIQDRVDLTLLEIKNYLDNKNCYEGAYKADLLHTMISGKKDDTTKRFLDLFDDFNDYVRFFCFEDFCVFENETYHPVDITKDLKTENDLKLSRNTPKIQDLSLKDLEVMLGNLCNMIKCRSAKVMENAGEWNRREN